MKAIQLLKTTTEYEVLQSFRDKVAILEQERSYSEEEVLEMMRITRRNEDCTVSQLFKQFKKK